MLQYRVVRNVRKVASKMPCHPIDETGKEVPCPNGTTSNFGKHTTERSQWIDILIATLEDMPMTASELKEKIAEFERSYPKFGINGGDPKNTSASYIFSRMRKEGLIVEVK